MRILQPLIFLLPVLSGLPAKAAVETNVVPESGPPANLGQSPTGVDDARYWGSVHPLEKAEFFAQNGDLKLAEKTYVQYLESALPMAEKKKALLALAEIYVRMGMPTKAVHQLESCLRNFPEAEERPKTLFRLGEVYAQMGLKDEAETVFYRVLNSIVVTGEENLKRYLGMARRAQFEIARLHYQDEEYERAFLLFDRIDLLELSPGDRETVHYYKSYSALKAGHHQRSLDLMEEFAKAFPASAYLPEIMYLKAEVLYKMDRPEASTEQLLRLLKAVGPESEDASKKWNFWRKQAGNRLANRHYEAGEFLVAVRIYQGMVGLDESPDWQLPIIYQIGLAFENAGRFERARESYRYVIQEISELTEEARSGPLKTLLSHAEWRRQLIGWRLDFQHRRTELTQGINPLHPPHETTEPASGI